MPAADVVILSAAGTPIGRYGGSFQDLHPADLGAARIVVTLLHELEHRNARLGLATLCVSGGMGMAVAIERCA